MITILLMIFGGAAFFNSERLRHRLNRLEDALIEKEIIEIKDLSNRKNK